MLQTERRTMGQLFKKGMQFLMVKCFRVRMKFGWFFFFFFFFCHFRAAPVAYEVPRLGVELELQLWAYTTATATPDPSSVCDLHHSSGQRWILNPLSKARDRTRNLMVLSRFRFRGAMTGTPQVSVLMLVTVTTSGRLKKCRKCVA